MIFGCLFPRFEDMWSQYVYRKKISSDIWCFLLFRLINIVSLVHELYGKDFDVGLDPYQYLLSYISKSIKSPHGYNNLEFGLGWWAHWFGQWYGICRNCGKSSLVWTWICYLINFLERDRESFPLSILFAQIHTSFHNPENLSHH